MRNWVPIGLPTKNAKMESSDILLSSRMRVLGSPDPGRRRLMRTAEAAQEVEAEAEAEAERLGGWVVVAVAVSVGSRVAIRDGDDDDCNGGDAKADVVGLPRAYEGVCTSSSSSPEACEMRCDARRGR